MARLVSDGIGLAEVTAAKVETAKLAMKIRPENILKYTRSNSEVCILCEGSFVEAFVDCGRKQ